MVLQLENAPENACKVLEFNFGKRNPDNCIGNFWFRHLESRAETNLFSLSIYLSIIFSVNRLVVWSVECQKMAIHLIVKSA